MCFSLCCVACICSQGFSLKLQRAEQKAKMSIVSIRVFECKTNEHLIQPNKISKCVGNIHNHKKCPELGPYGVVWADNCAESLPRGLGCLWDASGIPNPPLGSRTPLSALGG